MLLEHVWAMLWGSILLASFLGALVGIYKVEGHMLQYMELMTSHRFIRQVLDFQGRFTPYEIETKSDGQTVIIHGNPKWIVTMKNKQFYKVLSDGQHHPYTEGTGIYNKGFYYVDEAHLGAHKNGLFQFRWIGRVSKSNFAYETKVTVYPYRLYYGVVNDDF